MDLISVSQGLWIPLIIGSLIIAAIAYFAPAHVEYPNHKRTPNPIVRAFYSVGYFIGDFGPMLVNLFNVVYLNIRKLFAFIVGLLIEISFVVILIATIGFSISHSMELLEEAGATGYLKYLGILIFELSFISSATALTAAFMKKKKPHWFLYIGFVVGIGFVLWSNISQMNQTWTGWIIGVLIPLMLIIAEGTIAFQNRNEDQNKKPNQEEVPKPIENDTKIPDDLGIKTEPEPDQTLVPNPVDEPTENDSETGTDPDQNTKRNNDQKVVEEPTENVVAGGIKTNDAPDQKPVKEDNQKVVKQQPEETIENQVTSTEVPSEDDTKNEQEEVPEFNQESSEEVVQEVTNEPTTEMVEDLTKNDYEESAETNQQTNQDHDQNTHQESDQNLVQDETKNQPEQPTKEEEKLVEQETENPTKKTTKRATKTTNKRSSSLSTKSLKKAKEWAIKYYKKNGKAPGRSIIEKELDVTQPQAREIAKEIKKELGINKAS